MDKVEVATVIARWLHYVAAAGPEMFDKTKMAEDTLEDEEEEDTKEKEEERCCTPCSCAPRPLPHPRPGHRRGRGGGGGGRECAGAAESRVRLRGALLRVAGAEGGPQPAQPLRRLRHHRRVQADLGAMGDKASI